MRILVVQESDWIARGPHQSHHLMERLSKRGHEIRVIDYEIMWRQQKKRELISKRQVFEGVHKAIDDGAIKVIRPSIVKVPALDYISLIITHNKEIETQIEEYDPDIIVGFGILNSYIAINHAKKTGTPFVYYIIDELHRLVPEKPFQNLARLIESHNMKNADKVISINEGLREYTIEMGAPKEKTEVVRAGIDIQRFETNGREEIRKKYGINESDTVLFFMGWLYDFSGLKEVAQEIARNKYESIKLLVVGKGDLWDYLQTIKCKYNLDKSLIIVEWVDYNDIPKYLSASDICILPAYDNDVMKNIVPIKMYEYMAAKRPVIASRIYGIMKEFGENNGVIYINHPEEVLTTAIELIRSRSITNEGSKARKYVESYSWDRMLDLFETALGSV